MSDYSPYAYIHCVFGWDPHEDHPELLEAWDEFDVDRNPEGFEEAVHIAVTKRAIPERYVRRARLRIDWNKVTTLYAEVEIAAEIQGPA